jgi:hypothetical protein
LGALTFEVVTEVGDETPGRVRVEVVEQLLECGKRFVGLDRDARPLHRYLDAVAGLWLAFEPRREELDVALPDQRHRHDGRLHVGRRSPPSRSCRRRYP